MQECPAHRGRLPCWYRSKSEFHKTCAYFFLRRGKWKASLKTRLHFLHLHFAHQHRSYCLCDFARLMKTHSSTKHPINCTHNPLTNLIRRLKLHIWGRPVFNSAQQMTSFSYIFYFLYIFFYNNKSSRSPQTNKITQRSPRGGVKTLARMCTQFSPAHPQKRRLQRLRRLGLVGADSYKEIDFWWITIPLRTLAIIKGVDLRLRFLWQSGLGVRLKK